MGIPQGLPTQFLQQHALTIDGKKVYTKNDIDKIMEQATGEKITITLQRNDKQEDITLIPTKQE